MKASPLSSIADIQIGYQHRDKFTPINRDTNGSYRIIQIKDLDSDGIHAAEILKNSGTVPYLWPDNLYQVTPAGDPDRYQVTKGDVIFLYRGRRLSAIPITENLKNTIAAYHFYILRPDTTKILPEYLAWFINHPKSKNFLKSLLVGTHIQILPKNEFSKLEVTIPPIKTQRSIVQLERLRQKEKFIMGRLVDARKRLINGLTIQAATLITDQN